MAKQLNTDPSGTAQASGGGSADPTSSGDGGENENQDGKAPATLADLAAHKKEIQGLLSTQYQGVQSLLDRQSGNLKEALEPVGRMTKALEAMGIELTPEQTQELRESEVLHSLSGGEPGADGQPRSDADGETEPADEQSGGTLGALALGMMRERGVVILQTDEAELALIDQETKDPKVFMDSIDAAIEHKIQRLANPDTETGENVTDRRPGPNMNPRGSGEKPTNILPDKSPSGDRTSSQDFLKAGYNESDAFPADE